MVDAYPQAGTTELETRSSTTGEPDELRQILMGSDNAPALVAYYTKLLGGPASSRATTPAGNRLGFITVYPDSDVDGQNTTPGRFMWNIERPMSAVTSSG